MKKITIAFIMLFTSISLAGGFMKRGEKGGHGGEHGGNGPCKEKREPKHQARKALHECLESWGKENSKPDEADPTDDCSQKLSTFVQASKDLKACRVTAKSEKETKKEAQ